MEFVQLEAPKYRKKQQKTQQFGASDKTEKKSSSKEQEYDFANDFYGIPEYNEEDEKERDDDNASQGYVELSEEESDDEEDIEYKSMTYMDKRNYDEMYKLYKLAKTTYSDIYNNANARGTKKLKPVSMMGKPIQLEANNLETLSNYKYSVSTKADGLRFLLMFSNDVVSKNSPAKTRSLFFVDSMMNFWIMRKTDKQGTSVVDYIEGIDKCLLDGEIYLHNFEYKPTSKGIPRYVATKDKQFCIFFITFDILYGPFSPKFEDEFLADKGIAVKQYEREKDEHIGISLKPGPSASMVGFKGMDRWPTHNRRTALEMVFDNEKSQFMDVLRDIAMKFEFTILVSPFVDFDQVIGKSASSKYSVDSMVKYMENVFQSSLERQFYRNAGNLNITFPKINTDGLIFTPTHSPYVYDTWNACNNKQYKWKPKNYLTIDFQISQNSIVNNNFVAYISTVNKGKKGITYVPQQFKYNGKPCYVLLSASQYLIKLLSEREYVVVECIEQPNSEEDAHYFQILRVRDDKDKANARKTANSVMVSSRMKVDPLDNVVILKRLKMLENGNYDKNSQKYKAFYNHMYKKYLSGIFEHLDSESFTKLFLRSGIWKYLDKTEHNKLKTMIKKANSKENVELETRIVFNSNCSFYLVKDTLAGVSIPIHSFRFYSKEKAGTTTRLTCVDIEGEPVPYDISHKKPLENLVPKGPKKFFDDIKSFNITLSSEKVLKEEEVDKQYLDIIKKSSKENSVNYQSRVFISNLSVYWEIEIIEYANADSPEKAKENYLSGPRNVGNKNGYSTRIEIEYKPFSIVKNFIDMFELNYRDQNLALLKKADEQLNDFLGPVDESKFGNKPSEEFLYKFEFYKDKYNTLVKNVQNVDPEIIAQDYYKILSFIFNIYYPS